MTTAVSTETREAPREPMKAGGSLAAFVPQDSAQLLRIADMLARAGDMVPKAYQDNPPAIAAAVMRGMEIGLAPMQALYSIAVINGRAVLWGDALPALMQRAGHHFDVEIENEGDLARARAVATLTRGDTGKTVVRTFSMEDAKRAGLANKPGPWQQYPLRMLANRARAFAIRDGAADALMGLHISDEVSDYGPDAARDVTPKAPPKGGAIYADPDPVMDEIHEAETVPAAEAGAMMVDVAVSANELAAQVAITPALAAQQDAITAARQAAKRGTVYFRSWFNSAEGKAVRSTGALTAEVMTDLKTIAEAIDAEPFGLPPLEDEPRTEGLG